MELRSLNKDEEKEYDLPLFLILPLQISVYTGYEVLQIFPHSAKGEYDDPYDLMSTANALMHPSQYGLSGPGLNGPHLNYLGWLPMDRIFYFGRYEFHSSFIELQILDIEKNIKFSTSFNLEIYLKIFL